MIQVRYNQTIEVPEYKYRKLIVDFAGFIAHREQDGKFYICWWSGNKYRDILEKELNSFGKIY